MLYIFNEAGETINDECGNSSFSTHGKAMEYMQNNTGMLENGDKFVIVDFELNSAYFYQAQLTMTIESI